MGFMVQNVLQDGRVVEDQPGEDVPLGTGQVDLAAVIRALEEGGFTGAIIIEREAGNNRLGDIAAAKTVLEDVLAKL